MNINTRITALRGVWLVLVAVALFISVTMASPADATRPAPDATNVPATGEPTLQGLTGLETSGFRQELAAYMERVLVDVDRYWTASFATAGYHEPFVNYVIITNESETYESPCGTITAEDIGYCTGNDTIYLSTPMVEVLLTGRAPNGEQVLSEKTSSFAAAVAVAHEYGHQIQAELGHGELVDANGVTWTEYNELEADCYAGAWAHSQYYTGYLTQADLDSAVTLMFELGHRERTDDFHGTPEQRAEAFNYGYNTGSPYDCWNTYRGQFTG